MLGLSSRHHFLWLLCSLMARMRATAFRFRSTKSPTFVGTFASTTSTALSAVERKAACPTAATDSSTRRSSSPTGSLSWRPSWAAAARCRFSKPESACSCPGKNELLFLTKHSLVAENGESKAENVNLTKFYAFNNQLTKINLKSNPNLSELKLHKNRFSSIVFWGKMLFNTWAP